MLTGGAGRRMGAFKPTVPLDGRPLAAHVIAALRGGGCTPIVAVGGDREALGVLGVEVVADRWPGEGPLGGMVTACEYFFDAAGDAHERASSGVDHVLVAACDLGRLDPTTVTAMRTADARVDLLIASGQRRHPSLVRVSRRAAPAVRAAFDDGLRAVHRLVDVLGERARRLRVGDQAVDEAAMANFNTPTDLERRSGDTS